MNREELIALARTVADLRTREAEARAVVRQGRLEFEQAFAHNIAQALNLEGALQDAETALRVGGLELYRETSDKHPAPGIEVKEKTLLEYDGEYALQWAIEHKIFTVLDLNRSRFERAAPALNLPFVKASTVPQAQLARDMGKALAELPKTI